MPSRSTPGWRSYSFSISTPTTPARWLSCSAPDEVARGRSIARDRGASESDIRDSSQREHDHRARRSQPDAASRSRRTIHAHRLLLRSLRRIRRARRLESSSRAATDGTLGLKAIKSEVDHLCQDESAKFDGMPRKRRGRGSGGFRSAPGWNCQGAGRDCGSSIPHGGAAPDFQETRAFQKILGLLKTTVGVDFSQYKPNRSCAGWSGGSSCRRPAIPTTTFEYCNKSAEVGHSRDLLISVTEFFRDPAVFEALKESVFPAIVRERQPGQPIRVLGSGMLHRRRGLFHRHLPHRIHARRRAGLSDPHLRHGCQ